MNKWTAVMLVPVLLLFGSVIGFIEPNQGIDMVAEEPGKVVAINFESGDIITEGKLLVELDLAWGLLQ